MSPAPSAVQFPGVVSHRCPDITQPWHLTYQGVGGKLHFSVGFRVFKNSMNFVGNKWECIHVWSERKRFWFTENLEFHNSSIYCLFTPSNQLWLEHGFIHATAFRACPLGGLLFCSKNYWTCTEHLGSSRMTRHTAAKLELHSWAYTALWWGSCNALPDISQVRKIVVDIKKKK